MNFWKKLPRPIIGLAPMDGVTDYAFRETVAVSSRPAVIFTEFVSVEALVRGVEKVFLHLVFSDKQRPAVAQLFGKDPKHFYIAAQIIAALGFDGVDINMGCPAPAVLKQGGGASLIGRPDVAKEIIYQTRLGIHHWAAGNEDETVKNISEIIALYSNPGKRRRIPVSVKTRLGMDSNCCKTWLQTLVEAKPDAITVHGRTLSQLYHGQVDWVSIASQSELIRSEGITYVGNGNVSSWNEAVEITQTYGLDGVLIGRASLGFPWIFKPDARLPDKKIVLKTMLEQALLHQKLNNNRGFHELKKHFGWYAKNFEGAKELRSQLMQTESLMEVKDIVTSFLKF